MKWFYSKRGTEQQHGLVDDATLREMARTGELQPDDLVWPESSGLKWGPASLVPGLFPVAARQSSVRQPARQPDRSNVQPASSSSPPRRSVPEHPASTSGIRRLMIAAVAVFALCAGLVAVLLRSRAPDTAKPDRIQEMEPIPVDPKPEPEPFVPKHEPRDWSPTIRKIEAGIALYETNTTSELLAKVLCDNETNPVVMKLAVQLENLRISLDKLIELKSALQSGALKQADAGLLVKLSRQYEKEKPLSRTVCELLENSDRLAPEICASAILASTALADTNLMLLCSRSYTALTTDKTSIASCLNVSRSLESAGLIDEAQRVLRRFVQSRPGSGRAWLELAAIQSSVGNKKDSLESLRNATDSGDDEIRKNATSDPRFDPIRDNWRFKRYTRMSRESS